MNVLILAAGYATRLYPLTLNKGETASRSSGQTDDRVGDGQSGAGARYGNHLCGHEQQVCERFPDMGGWLSRNVNRALQFKIVNDGSTTTRINSARSAISIWSSARRIGGQGSDHCRRGQSCLASR